jgi:hypothetical protein
VPDSTTAAIEAPARGRTVADLAARFRVSPDKVRAWIKRGELAAVNTATSLAGRPRYLVTPEAVAAFENGPRAVQTKTMRSRSSKRRVPEVFYARR